MRCRGEPGEEFPESEFKTIEGVKLHLVDPVHDTLGNPRDSGVDTVLNRKINEALARQRQRLNDR